MEIKEYTPAQNEQEGLEMGIDEEEQIRKEFEDAEEEIKDLHAHEPKAHPGFGTEEMYKLAEQHPTVERFFMDGDEVLGLSEEDKKKLTQWEQEYLDGTISVEDEKQLEQWYIKYQKLLKRHATH